MIVNNVIDLIGNTPLVSLKETTGMSIFAKAEFLNPGGSIKRKTPLGFRHHRTDFGKYRNRAVTGRRPQGLPRYYSDAGKYE